MDPQSTRAVRTLKPTLRLVKNSIAADMPSADVEVYASLLRALGHLQVRWYIFGAQAAILHGAARFTEDIDITVDLGTRTTRVLTDALQSEGFQARVTDDEFIERTRVLPILHAATGIPVDVVLAGPGLEERFFEGVVLVEIEGIAVPVARAEDLVVMKILAGRPKDIEDVVTILGTKKNTFDVQRVRDLIRLLEQALDQRDLEPLLDTCLARIKKKPR